LRLLATKDVTFLLDPSPATRNEVRRSGYSLEARYLDGDPVSGVTEFFRRQARAARDSEGISDDRMSLWGVNAKSVAKS
jgi:hypothetical protein